MVVHVIFHGKVQGVGFRKFVKSKADQIGVTGYVKNLPDGTVEVVATGDKDTIERFIEEIKDGPERAVVESFDKKEIIIEVSWDEFEIRY